MEQGILFEYGARVYPHPKQAVAICEMVCKKLDFKISKTTKAWNTACNFITQIYNGSFLEKNAPFVKRTDCFVYKGTDEKILACKNDWNKVKGLFLKIIDNLSYARQDSYMPIKKTNLNNLVFSTFFSSYWEHSLLIYDLVQVPKRREEFFQQQHVNKIKKEMNSKKFSKMREIGESICEEFFSMNEKSIYYFWENLNDLFKWWCLVKEFKLDLYTDLKSRFLNQNLLEDYHRWLLNYLKERDGRHFQLQPWFYRAGSTETNRLSGYFAMYLRIRINEYNLGEEIEKNICSYYKPDSFSKNLVAEEDVPQFEYLTEEQEVIF